MTEHVRGDGVAPARPSDRRLTLPFGGAETREAFVRELAALLLEVRSWPEVGEIGDRNFVVVELEIDESASYVQFLSTPNKPGLLCEIASGFFGRGETVFRATDTHRRAMVARGFTDGRSANFEKDLVFDSPEAASHLAREMRSLLEDVFGWEPHAPVSARIHHARNVDAVYVFDGLSRADLVDLFRRHELDPRVVSAEDLADDGHVEASMSGIPFSARLDDPIENSRCHRVLRVQAKVRTDNVAAGATNPFNILARVGRTWVEDGEAFVGAQLQLRDVSERALHEWLAEWHVALTTARYWYRLVANSEDERVGLGSHHFHPTFHDLHRMARSHVKPSGEEASIHAYAMDARKLPPDSPEQIDAWSFFGKYAEENPSLAIPLSARFPSRPSTDDLLPWLARIDGVRAEVRDTGVMAIRPPVSDALLLVRPGDVRALSLASDRFALSLTLNRRGTEDRIVVLVGTDDFFFAPLEARIALGTVTFQVDEMPPLIGWIETRRRLRELERDLAWSGPLQCSALIAWLSAALGGAERAGIVVTDARDRFERLLAAARRSFDHAMKHARENDTQKTSKASR